MNAIVEPIEDARKSLQDYEGRVERYGRRTKGRPAVRGTDMLFNWESLLAFGVLLFKFINHLDETWRKMIYRKQIKYDPDMESMTEDLYRRWFKSSTRIMDRLATLEKHWDVEGAAEFRSAYREVEGILTPDEEFFTHRKLVRLRDDAVDAHRRGETEEMRSRRD